MTYNVFSGTLNPTYFTYSKQTALFTWLYAVCFCDGTRRRQYGDRYLSQTADLMHAASVLHCESKKGATLTMAITLSILDRFPKFFHYCREQ